MSRIKLICKYEKGRKSYSVDRSTNLSRTYVDDLHKLRQEIALIYGFEYSGPVFIENDPYLHYYIKKNDESVELTVTELKESTFLRNITDERVSNEALFMIEACKKLQKQLLETQYEKEYIFEM